MHSHIVKELAPEKVSLVFLDVPYGWRLFQGDQTPFTDEALKKTLSHLITDYNVVSADKGFVIVAHCSSTQLGGFVKVFEEFKASTVTHQIWVQVCNLNDCFCSYLLFSSYPSITSQCILV